MSFPRSSIEPLEPRRLLSTVAVNLNQTFQTIRAIGADFAKTARNDGAPLTDVVQQYCLANIPTYHARIPINVFGWCPKLDTKPPDVIDWSFYKDSGREHELFQQIQDFQKRGMFITASVFD